MIIGRSSEEYEADEQSERRLRARDHELVEYDVHACFQRQKLMLLQLRHCYDYCSAPVLLKQGRICQDHYEMSVTQDTFPSGQTRFSGKRTVLAGMNLLSK